MAEKPVGGIEALLINEPSDSIYSKRAVGQTDYTREFLARAERFATRDEQHEEPAGLDLIDKKQNYKGEAFEFDPNDENIPKMIETEVMRKIVRNNIISRDEEQLLLRE